MSRLGLWTFFCCGRATYRFYPKNVLINNNEDLLTLNITKKQAILCIGVEINEKFMYICSRLVSCREDLCEPWFHGRRGGLHTGEQAFALHCCCAWWLDVLSHSSATAAAAGQESSTLPRVFGGQRGSLSWTMLDVRLSCEWHAPPKVATIVFRILRVLVHIFFFYFKIDFFKQ